MRRFLCVLILFCTVFPNAVLSNTPKAEVGDSYIVKEGDSLWKVAERFIENPWLWPDIWKGNPQIKNPHVIYPGDTVHFYYMEGKPKLSITRGANAKDNIKINTKDITKNPKTDRTIKLSPRIRTVRLDESVPDILLSQIRGFIMFDRVFSNTDEIDRAPIIFSITNSRFVASLGDTIYVKGRLDLPLGEFDIYRKGEAIKDPNSDKVLGVMGYKVGSAEMVNTSNGVAEMVVVSSRMPIKKGDKILTKDLFTPRAKFSQKPPAEAVTGRIMAVVNGGKKAGKYNTVIVYVDSLDGLRPGDTLKVQESSRTRDKTSGETIHLPVREVGEIMIYRSFGWLSFGLVMHAKEELEVGDPLSSF